MENTVKKVTKREYFEMLAGIVAAAEVEQATELQEFIAKEIAALDNKAAKAKERAAKNKAEGDALREAVQSVLTEEAQTIDAITGQIEFEGVEVTRNKVVARLTQLVKADIAEKTEVKDGSKKVSAYKLKAAEVEEDAEVETEEVAE